MPARCFPAFLTALLALSSFPSSAGASGLATGGLNANVRHDRPTDHIPAEVRRRIDATIAAYEKTGLALPAPKATPATPLYPFFPQAGIQGQDLFLLNFADLNTTSGIRDWDCTGYTYDGHQGHDSLIRSFREQAIGVPIYAVLDGRVVDAHDGEFDMNTVWRNVPANYVVLDHGGGFYALYWHMKRGSVAVKPNQTVTTGTQIGLTGSSGFSTGPHLHFESRKDGRWFEPSAGRCRSGASFWKSQPRVPRGFYVADAYLAQGQIPADSALTLLLDNVPRTSTFVSGFQKISLRFDYRNLPKGSTWRLRAIDPAGVTRFDATGSFGNAELYRIGWALFWFQDTFSLGTWHYSVDINGTEAVDLPFTVVSDSSQVENRPPKPIRARLFPATPATGQIMICQVTTPLLFRDPDYDVVRYRYEWKVNGHLVRALNSAALTDVLAKSKSKTGDRVACRVTPADDRAAGASALAVAEP